MPHAFIKIIFGLLCLFILVIGKSQSDAEIAFIRPRILLFHDKNDVENDEVVIINALQYAFPITSVSHYPIEYHQYTEYTLPMPDVAIFIVNSDEKEMFLSKAFVSAAMHIVIHLPKRASVLLVTKTSVNGNKGLLKNIQSFVDHLNDFRSDVCVTVEAEQTGSRRGDLWSRIVDGTYIALNSLIESRYHIFHYVTFGYPEELITLDKFPLKDIILFPERKSHNAPTKNYMYKNQLEYRFKLFKSILRRVDQFAGHGGFNLRFLEAMAHGVLPLFPLVHRFTRSNSASEISIILLKFYKEFSESNVMNASKVTNMAEILRSYVLNHYTTRKMALKMLHLIAERQSNALMEEKYTKGNAKVFNTRKNGFNGLKVLYIGEEEPDLLGSLVFHGLKKVLGDHNVIDGVNTLWWMYNNADANTLSTLYGRCFTYCGHLHDVIIDEKDRSAFTIQQKLENKEFDLIVYAKCNNYREDLMFQNVIEKYYFPEEIVVIDGTDYGFIDSRFINLKKGYTVFKTAYDVNEILEAMDVVVDKGLLHEKSDKVNFLDVHLDDENGLTFFDRIYWTKKYSDNNGICNNIDEEILLKVKIFCQRYMVDSPTCSHRYKDIIFKYFKKQIE